MIKTASKIRFKAKLFRPAATAKVGSWTFLTLPKNASAELPSRGMTSVEGTINGFPFLAVWLERGSKGETIDGAFDRRHTPRGELRTGVLWQGQKGPRPDLRGRGRPE